MEKKEINYQNKIQNKLKMKYVRQLLICESALLAMTVPLTILNSKPQPVKIEKNITKEGIFEREIKEDEMEDNHLIVKTKWEKQQDGTYKRQSATYDLSDKTFDEIKQLVDNKEALLAFIIHNESSKKTEYKKVLSDEEIKNNELEIMGYAYIVDENYMSKPERSSSDKLILESILCFVLVASGLISSNYDIFEKEKRSEQKQMLKTLTDEEIKENKCKLNKCLTLARKKSS